VHRNQWLQTGASTVAAAAGSLLFISAAVGGDRPALPAPFDLGIQAMSVKQLSSTPMFRTVEITCVVQNRGAIPSNATGWLLISRPGDPAPQVLRMVSIPTPMGPGGTFQVRSQSVAWAATAVPYRCEIQFGGAYAAGDADPSNDFAEFTFPNNGGGGPRPKPGGTH
jgi:hypothetical protein